MLDELFDKRILAYVGLLVIPLGLLLELYSGTGVYAGTAYTIAVLLTLYERGNKATIAAAVACIILILFSVFYLHHSEHLYVVSVNSMLSLTAVSVAMFFVLYIKDMQRKAEAHYKQLDSLFTHATEGVILADGNGNILLVNPFAEDLFGYAKDELKAKNLEMLMPDEVNGEQVNYKELLRSILASKSKGGSRDMYARRREGSVFPVEVSLSHYTIGREAYVILFIIDTTNRRKSEQSLRNKTEELQRITTEFKQLNSMLEQKVEDRTMMLRETLAQLERSKDEIAYALEKEKDLSDLKSRFVSTVSHEFRTPLATILSSSALIAKYTTTEDNDKRARHTARIKESVKHMNAMLEDLLSLGKLDEGLITASRSTFGLDTFLDEFINEMKEIAKPGQQINCTHTGDIIVNTDKRLLKNVLINLLSNAVKFSPEDSVIDITSNCESGRLQISVKDSGIGISEEDQQHLFERFFRARNAANIQGTGLGLHIVSKYLELLHGDIALNSKLGEGTTFTINIQDV